MSWLLGDDDDEYALALGLPVRPSRVVRDVALSEAGVSMLGPPDLTPRRVPRDSDHGRRPLGVLRHCLEPVEALLGGFSWDDAAMTDEVPDGLTRRLQEWVSQALREHHRMMDAAAARAIAEGVGVLARYDDRGILVSAEPDGRVPFLEVFEVRGSDVDVDELLAEEAVRRLEAEEDEGDRG